MIPAAPLEASLDRRELLAGAAAIAVLAIASARLAARAPEDHTALLDTLSNLLIPGSIAAHPGAYLMEVLPTQWRGLEASHIQAVKRRLNFLARGDFLSVSPARRFAAVTQLDAESFVPRASGPSGAAWRVLKAALLSVWYTSEPGATGDLVYELVPGRWEPDIPLSQAPKPLANDWLAMWFT